MAQPIEFDDHATRSIAPESRDEGFGENRSGPATSAASGFPEQAAQLHVTDNEAPLSADQVRAARGMLGWTAQQLAEHSGVSFSTIRRIEAPARPAIRDDNLRAVRAAFEKHGVEFVQLSDGRTGVVSKP